jgi:integrase
VARRSGLLGPGVDAFGGDAARRARQVPALPEAAGERCWIAQARTVFLVIYGLALRRGEVLGLRWRDVRLADPLERPTLTVERAFVRGEDGPPKSQTSRRTLVLDEFLAGELRRSGAR